MKMEPLNVVEDASETRVQLSIEIPTFTLEKREAKIRQLLTECTSEIVETSVTEEGIDDAKCRDIHTSLKLRWSKILRDVLPESKLPISAFWRRRTGTSRPYTLGSCKDTLEYSTNYVICDIKAIDFDQLTASADVFYSGEEDPVEVSNIYLHELSLVNMSSEDDSESDEEDNCIKMAINDEEIKAANTILDHLRFFYTVIWFPWDERQEEEMDELCAFHSDQEDWIASHLEYRMKAYKQYINETDDIYDKLKNLAVEHDQLMNRRANISLYYGNEFDDGSKDDLIMVEIQEIEDVLDNIKKQADRMENPVLRNAFAKVARMRKIEARKKMTSDYICISQQASQQVVCLVTGNITSVKGLTQYMHKAQQVVGFDVKTANIILRSDIQSAIDSILPGDIIVLPTGEHVIKNWGELQQGGSMYGVDFDNPSLIDLKTMPGRYGIEVSNGAIFENIIISSSQFSNNNNGCSSMEPGCPSEDQNMTEDNQTCSPRHGILVKSGTVQMTNCMLIGLECAIKVMPKATLTMKRCKLNLNGVGILVEKFAGKIILEEVRFEGDDENQQSRHGIVIKENTEGNELDFRNVSLRYASGHFVFADPSLFFLQQKEKAPNVRVFKDSWEDVFPLLSKAVKDNLCLESYSPSYSPGGSEKWPKDDDVHPLLIVQDFYINHKRNKKLAHYKQATTLPVQSSTGTKGKDNEMGAGDNGKLYAENKMECEDMYITSSGSVLAPTTKIPIIPWNSISSTTSQEN